MKNRYIKVKDKTDTLSQTNHKCGWCGTSSTVELHHIIPFADGGSNKEDNLIPLCPNCHTDLHNNNISQDELVIRKMKLHGDVNRIQGTLSVQKNYKIIVGNNKYKNTPNIFSYRGETLLAIKERDNTLIISLRLYNKNQELICWMHDNRWWVEDEEVFEYQHAKNIFRVVCNDDKKINLKIETSPFKDMIWISGSMYLGNAILEFDKNEIVYIDNYSKNKLSASGNTFESCKYAFSFD